MARSSEVHWRGSRYGSRRRLARHAGRATEPSLVNRHVQVAIGSWPAHGVHGPPWGPIQQHGLPPDADEFVRCTATVPLRRLNGCHTAVAVQAAPPIGRPCASQRCPSVLARHGAGPSTRSPAGLATFGLAGNQERIVRVTQGPCGASLLMPPLWATPSHTHAHWPRPTGSCSRPASRSRPPPRR